MPEDPRAPVVLTDGQTAPLAVALPVELALGEGRAAEDGTIVYPGEGGTAAAVQALDDGSARVQTIIEEPHGPTQFTYAFGQGVVPIEREDGRVALVLVTDGVALEVGAVGEAWAVDANGRTVPTWYETSGSSLVQHVAVDEQTVFPVVADPLLTYRIGVYMNMTGRNWKVVTATVVGATVGVTTAACLGAKLPAAWAKAIGAACTLIGVNTGISAFVSALRKINNMNLTTTSCYQMKLMSWGGGGLTRVDAKNCQ